jgi:ABC-type Na+ efflux pump permease subunit
MLPAPIFRHELKAASGRYRLIPIRATLALLLAALAIAIDMAIFDQVDAESQIYNADELHTYALIVFAVTVGFEVIFLSLLTAANVGASIAEEREKDTLSLLLLTRLTRVELVATKLTGQMMPSLLLLLTGLPIIVTSAGCAGLPATFALEALGISATSVAVGASLAILASARRDRSGAARGEAIGWTVMWLGGLPIITLMPVSSGTLWGDLLVEIRRICSWIAPSSPLSLLTDTSWMTGSSSLSQRLLMMLALQIVVIIFALVGAVIGLRLREPRPTEWDPHRGYRPPVSDDPIFWREYILPWRGSRQPLVVILARQILILVRMILWISLRLLFLTAAVAVPIGSVIGAGWFGYYAFVELWNQGSFTAGKYEARYGLNLFIRGATAFLALVPLLALPGAVSWRMTIERDKKTWEPLLTTPLTGAEILSSKLRVSAVTLLSTARCRSSLGSAWRSASGWASGQARRLRQPLPPPRCGHSA